MVLYGGQDNAPTVTIDVAAPVNRITINWADGTATTVCPPAPAGTARPGTGDEEKQNRRHHP